MNLQDYIITYDNVLTGEQCDRIIEKFEADDRKHAGVVGEGRVRDIKVSTDLQISGLEDWDELDKVFFDALAPKFSEYTEFLIDNGMELNYSKMDDSGYQIQRTSIDGKYDWHNDHAIDYIDGSTVNEEGQPLTAQYRRRFMTYIFYLNDQEGNFEGGRTQFQFGKDSEIFSYTPKKGTLLLFPATPMYRHRGERVTSGEKYIATGWGQDYILSSYIIQ